MVDSSPLESLHQPPLVTGLAVSGLFNRFDHSVDLAPTSPFGIVIGPNGIGKTRFFELARAALTLRVSELLSSTYSQFVIKYSDRAEVTYLRVITDDSPVVLLSLRLPDGSLVGPTQLPRLDDSVLLALDRRIPLVRTGPQTWYDPDEDEVYEATEVMRRYAPEMIDHGTSLGPEYAPYVHRDAASLIETQRLIRDRPLPRDPGRASTRRNRSTMRSTVNIYSDELAGRLEDRFASSGRIGQQLDRTFASRVLKRTPPTVDEESVRQDYENQLAFRERLVNIGIADPAPEVELPPDALLEPELRLMEEYLEDSRKKLDVFNDVLDKVELMQAMIRDKFLYKRFSITRQGFSLETDDPEPRSVPISALSSGEQHELVLVYSLLFNVSPNSIVMIDEPELSLHVGWQRRFLSDLTNIAELSQVRFLVATHSPQIIDEWWQNTTELGEGWR